MNLTISEFPRTDFVSFVVFGNARPSGSKTVGFTRDKQPFVRPAAKDVKQWRTQVQQEAGIAMMGQELLRGALRLGVTVYRPRPRSHYGTGRNADLVKSSSPSFPTQQPDLTKLVRGIEDALTGIVWRDDAQVVEQHNFKIYGEPERVVITVGVVA